MSDPTSLPEAPVTARDLLVGCVTESSPRYLAEALRLVQSIRWFGGELAEARLLVCAVETIAGDWRERLESYGAEVRVVPRFHAKNGSANRLRLLEAASETDRELLLALDCDTLVVRDPLPLLRRGLLQAKIEPLPTVTHDVFVRLFRLYGLPLPPRAHTTGLTRTPTIPYFNGGVLVVPASLSRELVPVWGRFNRELADHPERVHPCERHLHQASLSLALAACPVPYEEAPVELNYQLNATHLTPPEGFLARDPAILHYHDLVDAAGYLLPAPYPLARMRIERFNRRLRQERGGSGARARRASSSPEPSAPPQIVLLGMHRAGLSAVAGLLGRMDLAAGVGERSSGPDFADPTKGSREDGDLAIFDDALLAALGASWSEVDDLDVGRDLGRLSATARCEFEAAARELVAGCDAQGPRIFADPRLCLLLPFWRRLLARPVCVLVHRDPLPAARSLAGRDGLPVPLGIALWELYARSALTGSLGLPRVVISWHDLLAAPQATLSRLSAELARLGVEGLRELEEAEIGQLVHPALDRHPSDPAAQHGELNATQRELLVALTTGAALALDPVPPLSAGARDTLAVHRRARAEESRLRREIDYRDGVIAEMEARIALERREEAELAALWGEELLQSAARAEKRDRLLAAVFASRSWRAGQAASRLLRVLFRALFRPAGPTARESWERLRAEIPPRRDA